MKMDEDENYTPDEFLKMFEKLYGKDGKKPDQEDMYYQPKDDEFEAEVVEAAPKTEKDDTDEKVADLLSDVQKQKKFYEQAEHRKAEVEDSKAETSKKGCHRQLSEVIDMLKTTGIAFLVGAAGTGKSTLAKQACSEIFGLGDADPITSGKYAQISFSPDTTSGEMIGRSDVNGNFHESEIVRVFRDGGVILFDEIDAADSSMLIKVNTALANGYLATPNGMVVKNSDTYIVCAANTFGASLTPCTSAGPGSTPRLWTGSASARCTSTTTRTWRTGFRPTFRRMSSTGSAATPARSGRRSGRTRCGACARRGSS